MIWRTIRELKGVIKFSEIDDMYFEDFLDASEMIAVYADNDDLTCRPPNSESQHEDGIIRMPRSAFREFIDQVVH